MLLYARIFKSIVVTEFDRMINDPFQVRVQIKRISPGTAVHPETGHLGKKHICIRQKQCLLPGLSHLLWQLSQLPSPGAGQIVHPHPHIFPDHMFQHTADPHTEHPNVRLLFASGLFK